jgi:hypothetical protein
MRFASRAVARSSIALAAVVATALTATVPAVAATTPVRLPHPVGGFIPGTVLKSAKSVLGGVHAFEVLPESVDLRPYAPAVGDQGQIGACVAWTIGYSIMGYYAKRTGGTGAPYAPLFLYMRNVAPGGAPSAGLVPDWVLANAQSAGVDTQADYWQGTRNWQAEPTQAEIDNARNYRVNGWSRLFNGANQGAAAQTAMMQTLAAGRPIALGIPVYQDFMYLRQHSLYPTTSGSSLGNHMITAYGYDAQGVYIRNSWGTSWGNNGDAKLSWAFITQAAFAAYAVNGLTTPAAVVAEGPTVASLSTATGPAGTSVTITGTGLSGVTSVRFGDAEATFTAGTENGLTRLVAVAPPHAPGVVDVTVKNPSGTSVAGPASTFTYVAPSPPAITSITPASGLTYVRTPVVVTGRNFTDSTRLTVGGVSVAYTRVSATQIRVTLPAHVAGAVELRLTTPGGVTPPGTRFTYLAPPAPVITSLSVATARTRMTTPLTITGRALTAASRVTVAGVPVGFTRVSDSQLRLILPARFTAGAVPLVVTTPGGTSRATVTYVVRR